LSENHDKVVKEIYLGVVSQHYYYVYWIVRVIIAHLACNLEIEGRSNIVAGEGETDVGDVLVVLIGEGV